MSAGLMPDSLVPELGVRAGHKPTRSEEVRERLADDIVKGRLLPGVALEEAVLSVQFGVSRTPVREAIRQLEAMGLARARPRRGAVVALITRERLDEMFAVMAELEGVCARESAERMTGVERRVLEAVHEAGWALARAGNVADYYGMNDRFHDVLYTGSHNAFLAEMTGAVRLRLAPFRRAQFSSVGRLMSSHQEHEMVVRAVLAGDGDWARRAMLDHILVVRTAFSALGTGVG